MVLKNKKGQVFAVAFMLAVVVILLGLAWAFPVNEMATNAMTSMNCSATTDDFVKAACWTLDIGQGYFIAAIVGLAGVLIAARYFWGGSE